MDIGCGIVERLHEAGAAVVIDEEDVLAIVAPLREMMWKTGDDDSG